jgi:ketosteroid isomerase-like protein
MTDTAEVREVIEQFRMAAQEGDIEALSRCVAREDDVVFYGSQAGDKQVGWETIRRSFEEQLREVSGIQSQVIDSTISVVGDLAWAAYDLRYTEVGGPAPGDFDTRWTCVLRRYDDGWKYVHMHHSLGR